MIFRFVWFWKLKKSVSSVSTFRVYHCTATISHRSDIPTNDVWEIFPLLKQRRLKLWKVCRLIRASTHTSVQLVPDVLNWRKIWRHWWPFHHIHVVCRQELCCGTWGMGASIILLQYCHTITCLHEQHNHWVKNIVSVFLGIKGTVYSHKLSFYIMQNSTRYHHRTAPKTICLNNACISITLSCTAKKHAFVHRHVPDKNATHLYTESVATEYWRFRHQVRRSCRWRRVNFGPTYGLYSLFLEASKYSLFTNLTTMTTTSLSGCACCSSLPVTKMLSSHAIVLGLSHNLGLAGLRKIGHMTQNIWNCTSKTIQRR